MRSIFRGLLYLSALSLSLIIPGNARAQSFDPRQPLYQLISAFQTCGPPQAYQMLSPYLFQLIAQQTGGSGCYQAMQSAGPVQGMQVIDMRQFPVGPLYAIRVQHQRGAFDWYIGFNQFTSRVEYLSVQPVAAPSAPPPTVEAGPRPGPTTGGSPPPTGGPRSGGDGCELYPAMCE